MPSVGCERIDCSLHASDGPWTPPFLLASATRGVGVASPSGGPGCAAPAMDAAADDDDGSVASEPLGFSSSGCSSSEDEFAHCESRSDDEAEPAAGDAEADADGEDSEASSDDELQLSCGLCGSGLVELCGTESLGVCDGGCGRTLSREEVTLSCGRDDGVEPCDWDICLPCTGRRRPAFDLAGRLLAAAAVDAPPDAAARSGCSSCRLGRSRFSLHNRTNYANWCWKLYSRREFNDSNQQCYNDSWRGCTMATTI